MTREEAKEAAKVMLAFAEGVEIQYSHKGQNNWLNWINESSPSFDWQTFDYRIKKEPKYRPFKTLKECWNEMLKHQPFGWIKDASKHINIIGLSETDVELSPDEVDMDFDIVKNSISFDYMFNSFVFADGTPFGIKED